MYESCYWKHKLKKICKKIGPKIQFIPYSYKRHEKFDMNVFIAMSILRKLRDRNKFTNEFCDKKWEISYFPKKKGVRRIDSFDCDIERFYDMKNEIIIEKDFGYIANLFVHSNSMSFSNIDKKRKVSEFYISSDYKQEKHYYKIPMHIIISILEEASKNHPHKTTWQYDEKKGKEVIVNE